MKYLITDKNIKWDKYYKNIISFSTIVERDNFVNNELHKNWKIDLFAQKNVHTMNVGTLEGNIEVQWKKDNMDIQNKNTIILIENEKANATFWWIESIENTGNNNIFKLKIKKNIFLTYPGIIDNMEKFSLIEGHIPVKSYLNYTFDGGNKKLIDIKTLKGDEIPKGMTEDNNKWTNQWLVVFRKLKGDETVFARNVIRNHFDDTYQEISLSLPYKIYAAPVINRGDGQIGNGLNASMDELAKWVNEADDGLTYAFKIIDYELDIPGNTLEQFEYNGLSFIDVVELRQNKQLNWLPEDDDYKHNQITINIPEEINSILELLEGVNEYSLEIEGVKNFNIPLKYIQKEDDKYVIKFKKTIGITPTETKQGIMFDSNELVPEIQEEYSFTNSTELATYVNQLNEYKANNPNSWADWMKPLTTIANPLNWLRPGTMVAGGVNAISSEIGTGIQRNSMKRVPETIKGDEQTYFLLSNTFSPMNYVMKKYSFLGNERKTLIDVIYRNGLQLQNLYIIEKYEDIKRPKFNFLRIDNFNEANTNYDLPQEVIEELNEIFKYGIRIWNEGFKEYDNEWKDNGEGIDDFVKEVMKNV